MSDPSGEGPKTTFQRLRERNAALEEQVRTLTQERDTLRRTRAEAERRQREDLDAERERTERAEAALADLKRKMDEHDCPYAQENFELEAELARVREALTGCVRELERSVCGDGPDCTEKKMCLESARRVLAGAEPPCPECGLMDGHTNQCLRAPVFSAEPQPEETQ